MARSRKAAAPSPLSDARAKIRDAEKNLVPLGREAVSVDAEGYEAIAALIGRGFGRKADVLRQALQTGLRGMVVASSPPERELSTDYQSEGLNTQYPPQHASLPSVYSPTTTASTFVPNGPPITTPPSVARRIEDGEDIPVAEWTEDGAKEDA